jgi:hypothetical protein
MDMRRLSREVFRRSFLTLLPECSLAGAVSLAVAMAAYYVDLSGGWGGFVLLVLPALWLAARTLQWAGHTWTATEDGRLIVRQGLLLRECEVILLCSVRQVRPETPLAASWLGVGGIAFQATDANGELRSFRWTWLARQPRLRQILESGGRVPIRRRSVWGIMGQAVSMLAHSASSWVWRGWALGRKMMLRLQEDWFVDDYGRFIGFCGHVLRSTRSGRWPPPRVPLAVIDCWMRTLREAHAIVDAPGGRGWQISESIRDIEDICLLISEDHFRQAVRRSTNY